MKEKDLMKRNFDEQLVSEAKSLTRIPSIFPLEAKSPSEQKNIELLRERILSDFSESVSKNLLKSIRVLKTSENFQDALVYPFLTFMDHSVYVDLMMQEVIRLSQNSKFFSENTRDISINIGNALETKYLHYVMNKNGDIKKVRTILFKFYSKRKIT